MNGEAMLVSDTKTSFCCKKDEIQRSEHQALRYAAFNHGYFRRPTVVAYVLSPTCDDCLLPVCITFCRVRHGDSVTKPDYYYYYYYYYYVRDTFECIFINAEGYV